MDLDWVKLTQQIKKKYVPANHIRQKYGLEMHLNQASQL
ncbi:hypothetical protein CEV33_0523 [Brucella grignonensis]|uniref:Uncharacterized protein n=1 Tax=Brucella grignonensis TaxID=94627 RepID=A0A256FFT7_9HYPH|nr:hypothetical protein CEV33_0523 [Brucella grignonensis]